MNALRLALITLLIVLYTVAVQFNEDCTYHDHQGFPQIDYQCAIKGEDK